MLKYLINLVILTLLFITCNNKQVKTNKNKNKNLILVDSLKSYSIANGWQKQNTNTPLKIVVYINGTCGRCIDDLSQWEKYIQEINSKKISFIFYIYGYNKEQIMELLNQINFPYPVIIDTYNLFYSINKLNDNKLHQAFLLNT